MGIPSITGKYVQDLVLVQLGGYANAPDSADIIKLINEGKNEVWAILKNLREDYFMQASQNSDSTLDTYFADLVTTTREYTLPTDFHEMKFIEVLTTGFEAIEFVYRDMSSEDFKDARRTSTAAAGGASRPTYFYDVIGKRTLILAQYPEAAFTLKLWYIRSLPDIELDGNLDDLLQPYANKIAIFVVKRLTLALQDQALFDRWREEWTASIKQIEISGARRDISGPRFVQDFQGWPVV